MLIVNKTEQKRYSTVYAGEYNNKHYTININNNTICGMEFELLQGDFSEEEVEQLANDLFDGRYKLETV